MGKLTGRTALVTGAGRNIGRATVLALAGEGADVIVHARSNQDEVDEVVREAQALGVRATGVLADLADVDQVERMIGRVSEDHGTVDILIANAAIRPRAAFDDVAYDDLRHVMAVNFESSFRLIQAFSPDMRQRGWGRIVTNAGLSSVSGQADRSIVSAAKMATLGLTRSLGKEFAPYGVTVNCISPGLIDTTRIGPDGSRKATDPARVVDIPVGRLGRVEDIAETYLFLVSDAAAFITAQLIPVNGGEASL